MTTTKPTTPLLRDADLRRYLAARVVSVAGSAVTYVAMPVLVYGITGSAAWTSLVVVAQGLPYLLFGLWAGALADHISRKTMMVVADLTAALALATIPAAWWNGQLTAAHVIAVAFTAQTVFVFFDAANFGALPSLVPRLRLPAANSLVLGSGMVVETVVPGLTGALLAVSPPATLVAVDAVSFLASALLVRSIVRPLSGAREHGTGSPSSLSAIGEGLRFIRRHAIVRSMTVVSGLQAFGGGAFVAVVVVWADDSFGIRDGDARLGLFYGSWGCGALLGAMLMPRVVARFGGPRTALYFVPLSAAAGLAVAVVPNWWSAVLALVCWGGTFVLITINAVTVRQQATPEPMLSRVMTTGRMLTFGAGYPLGAFTAGMLAEKYGAMTSMLVCMLSLVASAFYAWSSPLRTAPRTLALPPEPVTP